tara:strand:+ start:151 stop:363 length:213 start_codon:yes stop_codon:yes gene_type:complete
VVEEQLEQIAMVVMLAPLLLKQVQIQFFQRLHLLAVVLLKVIHHLTDQAQLAQLVVVVQAEVYIETLLVL